MRKVEAPPPSRWPMMAMRQVIRATPTTLLPTFFISAPMILSNMPASVMTPKNRTEKMNRIAVPWTPLTPSLIKPAISSRVKAPVATRMAAVMVETLTNASAGTVTLRSSRTMTVITVAKPSRARIVSLMGLYFLSFFRLPGIHSVFSSGIIPVRYGSSIQAQTYSPKPFSLRFVKKFLNIL